MTNKSNAEIRMIHGRPVCFLNGDPTSQSIYSTMHIARSIDDCDEWRRSIKAFIDSGVHIFNIQTAYAVGHRYHESPYWSGDGEYPKIEEEHFFGVDTQIREILKMDPEAKFYIRFCDYTPWAWFGTNPSQVQRAEDGLQDFRQISLASQKGLDDFCKSLDNMIGHFESCDWADKLIGYFFIPSGEGITTLNLSPRYTDICDAMQGEFKAWVKRNYATIEELRAAWGEPDVTFETVRVPLDSEWKRKQSAVLQWVEGNELRKERDYLLLMQELWDKWYRTIIRHMKKIIPRDVIVGVDFAKQPMMGWLHNLAFYGTGPSGDFPNILATTGSINLTTILDEPGLSALLTPGDYTARPVGFPWEPEGLSDSMLLRGKAIFTENDCRTYTDELQKDNLGAFKDNQEMRAGMLRNAANALSRGYINYWATLTSEFFIHPEAQKNAVQPLIPMYDAAPRIPHIETEHAIAMIIDDNSPMVENCTSGYQNLAVIWQRVLGLAHCGIPLRIYLLSDLERNNMPDYKCYIFPNLFQMDEKRHEMLKKKVFRDGRLSIFGPATGITDGDKLGVEWAEKLTGVQMELMRHSVPRRVLIYGNHEITRNIPASTVYGDSLPYGPVIVPVEGAIEAAGGQVLGQGVIIYKTNRPGLFVKDFGSHKIAWSAAVPLPESLLRELARWAGCHVWCEENDVISASESIVSLHSVKSGPRTISLPSARDVWDLTTGAKVGERMTEIQVDITAPETVVYYTGSEPIQL